MFQVPQAIALGTWNLFDYITNLIERIKQYTFVFAVLAVWVEVWYVLCTTKVLQLELFVFRYKTRKK